jgi:hypothetical protein
MLPMACLKTVSSSLTIGILMNRDTSSSLQPVLAESATVKSEPSLDQRIEFKYLLDNETSESVKLWARENLGVDAHCDPQFGDSYEVNTLYFDSPQFDLYHRTGVVGRTKHRIRRYGNESTIWLETKRKDKHDVVTKNRTAVTEEELHIRALECHDTWQADAPWCGDWFLERIHRRGLQPSVQVHYRRFARTAILGNESLRLTIDSHLQSSLPQGWQVMNREQVKVIDSANVEVLELKFHNHMPSRFKDLLRSIPIKLTPFSKYRTSVEACELISSNAMPPSFGTSDSYASCAESEKAV